MLKRYSIIPVFVLLLGGLALWSSHVESSRIKLSDITRSKEMISEYAIFQRDLIEFLDRVVANQHYYHSVKGQFVANLDAIGMPVPQSLAYHYDIQIVEATKDHLGVSAILKGPGRIPDVVSIDQNYQVHANFHLPVPRESYLKHRAVSHLRSLWDLPNGQIFDETGVYKGYFHYAVENDPKSGRTVRAIGVRPPVAGLNIALNQTSGIQSNFNLDPSMLAGFMGDSSEDDGGGFSWQVPQMQSVLTKENDEDVTNFAGNPLMIDQEGERNETREAFKISHFRFSGEEYIHDENSVADASLSIEEVKGKMNDSTHPKSELFRAISSSPMKLSP